MKIAIISASVRVGRNSHRVALFLKNYIIENNVAAVDMLDLHEYNFPIFDERLRNMKDPAPAVLQFAEKINNADGVIMVTPEYNGGYPASLKNAVDLLFTEWKRKPVAFAPVSAGPFGGAQVITSLLFSLWKLGAYLVPAVYHGPKVQDNYSGAGVPTDKETTEQRAKLFLEELVRFMVQVKNGTNKSMW